MTTPITAVDRVEILTHCTGRNAVAAFEKAMPEKVMINMAGTRLVFSV